MQVTSTSYYDSDILSKYSSAATTSKTLSEADKKTIQEVPEKFNNRYDFTNMSASELKQFTSIMVQVGQMSEKEASSLLEATGASKAKSDDERTNVLSKVKSMMQTLMSSGDAGGAGFWSKMLGKLEALQGTVSSINVNA